MKENKISKKIDKILSLLKTSEHDDDYDQLEDLVDQNGSGNENVEFSENNNHINDEQDEEYIDDDFDDEDDDFVEEEILAKPTKKISSNPKVENQTKQPNNDNFQNQNAQQNDQNVYKDEENRNFQNQQQSHHSQQHYNENESDYTVVRNYILSLEEKIEKLEEDNLHLTNEIKSISKRHVQENKDLKKYGGADLAEDLLKPLDLFKKVIETPVKNKEVQNYLIGFEMILKQISQVMESNGITMIPVNVGDEFDPNIHNANEAIVAPEFEPNKIVEVISNGYKLHDRIISHAIVKVSK